MAWTGTGSGISADPWQITTPAELISALNSNVAGIYMKVMNNIDMTAQINYYASLTFDLKGHFDGNGKTINNLRTGTDTAQGLQFWSGAELKNITLNYTTSTSTSASNVINTNANTLSAGTLQNVHVTATGSALLKSFSGSINYGTAFVISGITLEGNVRQGFLGNLSGSADNVRLYRTAPAMYYEQRMPCLFTQVNGTVSNCQVVVPSYVVTGCDMAGGMIVYTIQSTTTIQKCLILANINITQNDPATTNVLHLIYGATNGTSAGAIVQDCLVLGNFHLNGGTISGGYNGGPSGFILGAGTQVIHRRNVFNGDLCNTYFNNRPPMSKAGLSVEQVYLYFNSASILSMTATGETGKQTGLTSSQMAVQSNFTGLDFSTVWSQGASNPELIDNPIYSYTLPLKNVSILSSARINSGSFGVALSTFAVSVWGVDFVKAGVVVHTSNNELNPVVSGIIADGIYTINPFYYDGATKVYTSNSGTYEHFFNSAALTITEINETARVSLSTPANSTLLHGSIFYNGYFYGTTRNNPFPTVDGYLVRAPQNNISGYDMTPIRVSDPVQSSGSDRYSKSMEQIVLCGGKLYAMFYNASLGAGHTDSYIMQYDTVAHTYKVFGIMGINVSVPIFTDGVYLYLSDINYRRIHRLDPIVLTGGQYNPDFATLGTLCPEYYNEDSQGGYISGLYNPGNKGTIHSAITDSTYLYLAYTSPATGFPSGYDATTGQTYCEIHKVKISDLSAAGWAYVPQCTDDMSQNADYLFLGVEVQPGANPATRGFGWTVAAVKKSDLTLTGLGKLHSLDNPPVTQSYGALVMGNYLITLQTNRYIIFVDISNPGAWSPNDNAGAHTSGVYLNKYSGVRADVPINEIVSDSAGNLYAAYWQTPTLLSQFSSPLGIYAAPTLENFTALVINGQVDLFAHVLNNGGQQITAQGILYGTNPGDVTTAVAATLTGSNITATLLGLEGIIYWKVWTTNNQGTTTSPLQSFTAPAQMSIYFGGNRYDKAFLGLIEIKLQIPIA